MDSNTIILIGLGLVALFIVYKAFNPSLTSVTDKSTDKCEDMVDLALLDGIPGDASGIVKSYGYTCGCNKHKFMEHIERFNDVGFEPDFAWLARNNLLPWWNSTRHTRNMSYDLRGDVPIVPTYVGPWMNSPLI
ncbi:hypothetical protein YASMINEVIRUS_1441 [Yasminevirus sp. GU-2018]|uniref:Uncharacterized protein n=1 Tax=Yasminevirus sp. GU-2018 TaxID=2420051 RepID=A0A5K0U9Z3_9VIRU|nr:hypothetical protein YASMINEVIRUS_1441 [Yasminevirus sp. GU-2018]